MSESKKQTTRRKNEVIREISKTVKRSFPSFDNLAAWVVDNGGADSVESIRVSRPELWSDLLFEWYSSGQIACLFAVHLARLADTAKWYSAVVEGPWDGDYITAIIDASIEQGAEGLQILFPGHGTDDEAITIVERLAVHSRWRCDDTGWLAGEEGDSIQIGLRWIAPDRSYESWAVGIAPFETMPFTRRFVGAPFIALIVRPLPPAGKRAPTPEGPTGLPASHLAHMDDALGQNQEKRDKWTEQTKLGKRALIHPEPLSRARAKVTFSFPPSAQTALMPFLKM
ncbi:hypothetical protein [Undibacterium sp. TJN19]|uniref:hypothetical protein n=1 Tax=Undibacterium sp. TJN19 TaxID=3413055 RepID=UPI003BF097BF